MNKKTVAATNVASVSLIVSTILAGFWHHTDSPALGTVAILIGLVAVSATISSVVTLLWRKDSSDLMSLDSVTNEFSAVSGS